MKKMLSILLTVIILLSLSAYADTPAATPDQIQIQFKVGDSILQINGQRVEVQTPYVEDGVTLVPLRVITEAFGAVVLWEDATQKITLTYEGTAIVLQIGNKNAAVNGKDQPLLVAPQMVNDKTMVPLRFITETFGAQVSYDEKTEVILVTMQKAPLPSASPVPSQQPTATPTPAQSPESTAAITISEADEQGYKTYTNKTLELSFKFPKDYMEMPNENNINEVVLWKQGGNGVDGMIYFSVFRGGEATAAATVARDDHSFLATFAAKTTMGNSSQVFTCSDLQSNKDLSGLDTRFFTYTYPKLETKIKTMYAVNGTYIYNLRFYDHSIDWKPSYANDINILKDIHIDQIEDQLQTNIINEWSGVTKPSYYSSDFHLTLPSSWQKTNVEAQKVTFTHESGIVFSVADFSLAPSETITGWIKPSSQLKEDPCASNFSIGSYKKYLWGGFVQYIPSQSPPQFTFYQTNYYKYAYEKDGKTSYNTVYEIDKYKTIYIVRISIPEEIHNPTTHVILDKIIKSIIYK